MQKFFSLIIKANQDFIRHNGDNSNINAPVLNSFYESISNIYIPLLRMLKSFEDEGIKCCFGLVLPPVLCNMLSDPSLQEGYVTWLDERITLGHAESRRNKSNEKINAIIKAEIENNKKLKSDFTEVYSSQLIPVFSEYMTKGYLELLGTCGTDIFMPHYADMREIVSAQIESGLHAYRQFFGIAPEGFWLPELGYAPGIEKLIRAYGYTYTILDSRSVLFAEKIPDTGIFYPSRTDNSLVVFARNHAIDMELFGEEGKIYASCYRNQNRDVGFELTMDQLSSVMEKTGIRYTTGYKYWNRHFTDEDISIYDSVAASEQVKKDALEFVEKRNETLNKAAELLPKNPFVVEVCALDISKMSKTWYETIQWIEQVLRNAVASGLNVQSCGSLCENQYDLEKIEPYYSAGIGTGYGENLLSSKNCWMMRYVRKCSERMIDLAGRFPNDTGLKNRLLNLGAKELMLAQSANLAKMINRSEFPDFAERRFKESILAFTSVFDSLGSNTVSTEWLTRLEAEDSIFPWMNYRIFSKKR